MHHSKKLKTKLLKLLLTETSSSKLKSFLQGKSKSKKKSNKIKTSTSKRIDSTTPSKQNQQKQVKQKVQSEKSQQKNLNKEEPHSKETTTKQNTQEEVNKEANISKEIDHATMEDILLKSFRLMFLWYRDDISDSLDIQVERYNKRNIDVLTNFFFNINVKVYQYLIFRIRDASFRSF